MGDWLSVDELAERVERNANNSANRQLLAKHREHYLDQARDIADTAVGEDRGIKASEQREFDKAMAAVSRIDMLLADITPVGIKTVDGSTVPFMLPGGGFSDKSVPVLSTKDKLSSRLTASEKVDVGSATAFVRGIITGDWRGAPETGVKTLVTGTGSAGGYLVPTALSAQIIDRARAKTRVIEAGALTIPMRTNTLNLARVAGDPGAGWKLEAAAATSSDMVFEQVQLQARMLMGLAKVSIEAIEDAQNIDDVVEDALSAVLALELDRVALRGSGTPPEPRGIRNTSGVTVNSPGGANGATPTSYSWFSTAVQTVQANNFEPNAIIYAPRTAGTLDRLTDTTNQPLRPPPSFEELRKLATTQIPVNLTTGTSTDTSEAYVGDFRQVAIGMRTDLVLEASRQASDATDSAFRQGLVFLRAYLRADIAVLQPGAFYVVTGIRP